MATIMSIHAREILDSRGSPTVEVDLVTGKGTFRAAVPSGASTGIYEAVEVRDGDAKRYHGRGVLKAVNNVNTIIAPALKGKEVMDQHAIDKLMVEQLDGSKNEWGWNKGKLGANAILPVSMAICRAAAAHKGEPLFYHIADLAGIDRADLQLPVPCFNVLNGGSHAGNRLAMQEFMLIPVGAQSFSQAVQMGCEVYACLKKVIKNKYGIDATNVGDEGGFAPNISDGEEALVLIDSAIKEAGHTGKVKVGLDVAASEFYDQTTNTYNLNFKGSSDSKQTVDTNGLIALYQDYINKHPVISIEDPFDQNDWSSYTQAMKEIGKKVQVVGDDNLVTNCERIKVALEKKACNALLLKLNQIGTVSEAIQAAQLAYQHKWKVMVSHRSGETEDTFIADLVVGINAKQIKTGAPCRSERNAKYNQISRIAEILGNKAHYANTAFD